MIEKAREEKREELESSKMALWDRPEKVEEELIELPPVGVFPNPTDIWGEGGEAPAEAVGGGPSSGHASVPLAVAANDDDDDDDGDDDDDDDDVQGVPNPSLRLDPPSTLIKSLGSAFYAAIEEYPLQGSMMLRLGRSTLKRGSRRNRTRKPG